MGQFRFEDLEIWQMAIEIGDILFDIAEALEKKKLFRFAEQLRSAGMSISNNIAEGSGSVSNKEFSHFLNIARRSIYECANIIFILLRRALIREEQKILIFEKLEILSRKVSSFRRTLS
jgi:four helix bundle protein